MECLPCTKINTRADLPGKLSHSQRQGVTHFFNLLHRGFSGRHASVLLAASAGWKPAIRQIENPRYEAGACASLLETLIAQLCSRNT